MSRFLTAYARLSETQPEALATIERSLGMVSLSRTAVRQSLQQPQTVQQHRAWRLLLLARAKRDQGGAIGGAGAWSRHGPIALAQPVGAGRRPVEPARGPRPR